MGKVSVNHVQISLVNCGKEGVKQTHKKKKKRFGMCYMPVSAVHLCNTKLFSAQKSCSGREHVVGGIRDNLLTNLLCR